MMKSKLFLTCIALFAVSAFANEDELISQVMEDGFKGKTSPIANVLAGSADQEQTKSLVKMVKSLEGSKVPVGNQDAYNEKIKELIAALDAVAGGDRSEPAIERLKSAQNCKACHTDHKP